MRFTFYGGAGGEVTGSCLLVETDKARLLVDFGMFQGSEQMEKQNHLPKELPLHELDAVVLTHAHLDHCGRLPLLAKAGYRGPVFATPATHELADLIMRDAAKIQLAELAARNRRRARTGHRKIEPLYTLGHVARIVSQGERVEYNCPAEVAPGVTARFVDAGHLLGSSSVELAAEDAGNTRTVVVSGDLGQRGAPLNTDPVPFKKADIVFIESTYGDRDHRPLQETLVEARQIIEKVVDQGGKILVPAFALGRTQQILYLVSGGIQRRQIPAFPIFLDTPMGQEATEIYSRHVDLWDEEALALYRSGELRSGLRTLQAVPSARESRALAKMEGPCMIIAGSGMCNAGRIRGHLQRELPFQKNAVLIVGYQAEGTLGRQLIEGAESVWIDGLTVPVRASIHTLGGLSAHAGQTDLVQWLDSMAASRPRVVIGHGEEPARQALGAIVRTRHGLEPLFPKIGDTITV